jgi:mRNA interferase RelE/StbE
MSWEIEFLPEAVKDIERLDGSVRQQVRNLITKAARNPLPREEGGYGLALRNGSGARLAGLLKLKLSKAGLRVVYALKRTESMMTIVVVGVRDDRSVYHEAEKRRSHHGL